MVATDLEIEIGGLTTNDRDRIHVDGPIDINGGIVHVSTIDGFTPQTGQTFEILTSLDPGAGVNGAFFAVEPADRLRSSTPTTPC